MQRSFLKTEVEVRDWFAGRRFNELVIDIETGGLGYNCKLKGISSCDGKRSCYINLNNNPEILNIVYGLSLVLVDAVDLLIGHNITFDLRVLKQYGVEYTGKLFDTMVAAHLLNENAECGLKDLMVRILKVPEKDIVEFTEAVKDGYDSQKFMNYGINDSERTWELKGIETPLLTKQGLDKLFYEIEMPFQYVLIEFYLNGIKVDTKKLKEFDDILTKERAFAEMNAVESIGLKMIETPTLFSGVEISSPINLGSSPQIAKIIEGKLGFELPRTSPSKLYPSGQASTAAEVLEPLKGKHPFIKHLLRYRKCEKLLNTFIQPLYGLINKDGRLRTHYNDCIAGTGRLSSSDPNLQNIPKELSEDDIINVRELFIADTENGKVFVRADYDLQEIRQLANVTGDKNLIRALTGNYDIHLYSANGCLSLGLPDEKLVKTHPEYKTIKEQYKVQRNIGKNGINFPVIYGSTAYGVSRNNNVSEEEAQEWIDGFFRMYPDVMESINQCKRDLFRNHYVRTYFGRKRRLFLRPNTKRNKAHNEHCYRQAFNMLIQGMCADLLRITLYRLLCCYNQHPEWGARLVLTVHDDVITECNKRYAPEVLKAKKEIMENVVTLPVKFLVDIGVCESYAG